MNNLILKSTESTTVTENKLGGVIFVRMLNHKVSVN